MSNKIPEGYIKDARGNLIPEGNVREIDKTRNELVCDLIGQAKAHAGTLATFKTAVQDAIQDFVQESASRFRVKLGGKKGNVTLLSFDGQYKVVSANSELLAFDERLVVAKELISRCIKNWGSGANDNLMALVNRAFDVDSDGNVNAKRILDLKTLKIDDPNWKKAMEAISQAVQVVNSKNYVRFYERQENGEYKQISLNIASE